MAHIRLRVRASLIGLSAILAAPAAYSQNGEIEFEGFLFPDNVVVSSERSLILCLVNQGQQNQLIRDGLADDHLVLSVPLGGGSGELEADGSLVSCATVAPDWRCDVDVDLVQSTLEVTVGPFADSVVVPPAATVCFDIDGVQVNGVPGLTFSELSQLVDKKRAAKLRQRPLPVFKTQSASILHDDLADIREDQHHVPTVKTRSFAELNDTAQRNQIPEAVHALTADQAAVSGTALAADFAVDAGALDGLDSTEFAPVEHDHSSGSNTSIGLSALDAVTSGSNNTAAGLNALAKNTTGGFNSAFGRAALFNNTTGGDNTAFGATSLFRNVDGFINTAIGASALRDNTEGDGNASVGAFSLQNNTTGGGNTAMGRAALAGNLTGSFNTAIGSNALDSNTTGSRNVAVGYEAGSAATFGSENIYVRHPGEAGESSTIRVGVEGTHSRAFLAGVRGGSPNAPVPVFVGTEGQLGTGGLITGAALANDAVDGAKIQDGTVSGNDVANGSLTSADIAPESLTTAEILNRSVRGDDLVLGTVTGSEIRDGTVQGVDIQDGTVTGDDLQNGTVTSADLAPGNVTAVSLSAVWVVAVECNGECGDSTLGQICDAAQPGYGPIAVNTVHDFSLFQGQKQCGGDNKCTPRSFLHRGANLADVCKDDGGWDCHVFCMRP